MALDGLGGGFGVDQVIGPGLAGNLQFVGTAGAGDDGGAHQLADLLALVAAQVQLGERRITAMMWAVVTLAAFRHGHGHGRQGGGEHQGQGVAGTACRVHGCHARLDAADAALLTEAADEAAADAAKADE